MMRKLLILMAVAMVTLPPVGCGRCRRLFHRGAPCGTTVAPALLSAPLAIGRPFATPVVSSPVASSESCCCESAPVCSSCGSCSECQNGWTTSGYADSGCAECGSGGPATTYDGTYIESTPSTVVPQSSSDRYDPGSAGKN